MEEATIIYNVCFTGASGNPYLVATDRAVVTVDLVRRCRAPVLVRVKNGTPTGACAVVVKTSDDTGTVVQTSSFTMR